MTDDVAGGLDEPDELEPEQGALALASPEDDWSRADWEKAAAAVLRKSRRLPDDDPDERRLGSAHPHDVRRHRGHPARHAGPGAPLPRVRGRPAWALGRAGACVRRVRRGLDLEGGATSLWVLAEHVAPDAAGAFLDGVLLDLAPVVLEAPTAGPRRGAGRARPAAPRHQPGRHRGRRTWSRSPGSPSTRACAASSSTRPPCTTRAPPTRQELGWVARRGGAGPRGPSRTPGSSPSRPLGLVEFRFAATDEQFPTIAKLRAAAPALGPGARAQRRPAARRRSVSTR